MSNKTRRSFIEDSLLASAAALTGPAIAPLAWAGERKARSRNEVIRVGVIGVRGRGRNHVRSCLRSPDAEVAAICDPDEGVIGLAMEAAPDATYYKDIRKLLDDDTIDAVSIATPNHWHSLASIWAMQAGKHVYVEKPLSHNVWEGRKLVEAAQRHGVVVQHGTQSRTQPATRDAMQWLHEGGLGTIEKVVALCYKRRESIGKVDGPQQPPATLDYDLWTGPAEMQPLMRKNLHYDWHWVFNTGNGDIGNQGVHQMDIARWGSGHSTLPTRITSCGGRLGYDDDGNTPNTQIASYHFDDGPQIIFEVRGLPTDPYHGAHIGVVFHGEGGYLVSSSYSEVHAFDHDGNNIKTFSGGGDHYQNFLDAIKNESPKSVNALPEDGHLSSAMCHLGNISWKLGEAQALQESDAPFGTDEHSNESFIRFRDHLVANGLDPSQTTYRMGPTLTLGENERFTGQHADAANPLLTRAYRAPFIVPENV